MASRHSRLGLGNGIQAPVQTFRDLARDSNARMVRSETLWNSPTFECCWFEDFLADTYTPATTTQVGLGNIYTVGSPTTAAVIANEANGVLKIKCASTSEAETNAFDWTDQCNIPANKPFYLEVRARIPTSIGANQRVIIGLASPYRANVGSLTNISRYCWMRFEGNNNLVTELYDGTTRTTLNPPKVGTYTITPASGDAGFLVFTIERNQSGTIAFRVADTHGGQVQSLNGISGAGMDSTCLQPIVIVQKDSGTGQPECDADYVLVKWDRF